MTQITRFGFFAEQIPDCFTTEAFSNNAEKLLESISIGTNQAKNGNKNATSPIIISTYKNELSRRLISISNPEAFLRVVKLMQKEWDKINSYSYSNNSLSPITIIADYNSNNMEFINEESVRNHYFIKSDFVKNIKECIRAALGYRYRLSVDISNFYNSIYTHSISWAICEKKMAKKYHITKEPESLKSLYEFADHLDAFTRFQKNNETNGIVVGPYTSRIFSEILLSRIDKELTDKKLLFRRYVDDYKFYFRSEYQAKQSLNIIENTLNEYNLNLNQAKTELVKFPFDTISNINNKYKEVYEKSGTFEVLNQAGQLYQSGEKGAYKYALKFLKNKYLDLSEFELIWPLLINIMLLDPKYGKYIIIYIKEHLAKLNLKDIENIINEELKNSLKENLQQEILLFLSFVKELKLCVTGENMVSIFKTRDDLSLIIALDLWKNRNQKVIRTRKEAKEINKLINELFNELKSASCKGEHWLLLYEIRQHKFAKEKDYAYPDLDLDFFKKMEKLKISFYSSVKRK